MLDFDVTNNGAEYEACLHGLQAAIGLNIKKLKVHGDSSLIINQVTGNWKIKSESLAPYQSKIDRLLPHFDYIDFVHLPREENQFADALSKLASLVNIPDNVAILPILVERRCEPAYVNTIEGESEPSQPEPWYQEIVNILAKDEYPPTATEHEKDTLWRLASTYILDKGELLKMTMLPVHIEYRYEPNYVNDIEDENEQPQPRPEPWYQRIVNFKTNGEYPPNTNNAREELYLDKHHSISWITVICLRKHHMAYH